MSVAPAPFILIEPFLQASFVEQCKAQVVVRYSEIGFDGEGFVITGHGLIQLPQFSERIAEIAAALGEIGLDGEGFVVARHSLIKLPSSPNA